MKRMKREKILAYNIRTQEDIIFKRTENLKVTIDHYNANAFENIQKMDNNLKKQNFLQSLTKKEKT